MQTEDTKVLNVPEEAELDEGSYNGEDSWDALVELYKKENEKLKDQFALMKKDLEEVHSENESFQTEVEALRLELKRRNSNEEYRERAFTNLRKAIKKKDKLLKSLEDELNYTQMDKNYYLYQIELLEDKLKETEEKNDDLQFECDELREMVKELKKIKEGENNFSQMDKNYYLHQIELLEHELKESNESKEDLQFECDELREMVKELKKIKEGENNFSQMDKNYYLHQIELLEHELKESKESNEDLQFECDELRETFKELKEMKEAEDNFAQMDKNYYLYQIELLENKLKESKEKNEDLQFECDKLKETFEEFKEIKADENNFAQMDKNYYLYQIELLEEKLRESKESNEVLQFECDEVRETFKELKAMKEAENNFAQMDKNYYLYQIELLEEKLKERKESNEVLQFECDELRETFKEFKEIKEVENNFAQMNMNFYLYQIELLEDRLRESKESNENFSLVCALISNHPIFLVFK